MPRRYFTDVVQALWLMKEFGVKFECFSDELIRMDGKRVQDVIAYDFKDWGVAEQDISELLDNFKTCYPKKIYVTKESESIFEPRIKDFAKSLISETVGEIFSKSQYENRVALARIGEENGFIYRDSEIQIIMRDNTHFFVGGLEND